MLLDANGITYKKKRLDACMTYAKAANQNTPELTKATNQRKQ
jgi:hypothetical protein